MSQRSQEYQRFDNVETRNGLQERLDGDVRNLRFDGDSFELVIAG